jgi:tRNA uridine 5-carbamoylmethylation protein Kti12
MIIFIEGIDKSGKSTLAKYLAKAFNLEIQHLSKPKTKDPFIEYSDLIENLTSPIIYDRTFLGEYVYANLWRNGCTITPEQFRYLEAKLLNRCTNELKLPFYLIYACAPKEVIEQRCLLEKEELLQIDQIEKGLALYAEIMAQTQLPFLIYSSDSSSPSDICNLIKGASHESMA